MVFVYPVPHGTAQKTPRLMSPASISAEEELAIDLSPPAYSLLCDPFSSLAVRPTNASAMKAHLVLNYILSGSLCFSDTQCLTSPNLASILCKDGLFNRILREGGLSVATRNRNHTRDIASLTDLVDTFGSTKNKARYRPLFLECAQLISSHGRAVKWDFDDVSQYYTDNTLTLIERIRGEGAPALPDRAIDLLLSIRNDRGIIKRDDLYYSIPERMAGAGESLTRTQSELLRKAASAYYFSAIPQSFGLSPIYGRQHRPVLNLRSGRHLRKRKDDDISLIPTRVRAEHLVEGLAGLTSDDVESLRCFATTYRERFARFRFFPDQANLFALRESAAELHGQIDDAILDRHPHWSSETGPDSVRKIRSRLEGGALGSGVAVEAASLIMSHALPFLGILIDIAFRIAKGRLAGDERFASNAAARKAARMDAAADRLALQGSAAKLRHETDVDRDVSTVEIVDLTFLAD